MTTKGQWGKGFPTPLGANYRDGGINFALFSENASEITLCLFYPSESKPFAEVDLDPQWNKTGSIWHIFMQEIPREPLEYGFRVSGPQNLPHFFDFDKILIDPYAKGVASSQEWGDCCKYSPRGKVFLATSFDWGKDLPPAIPVEDVIIYEMYVRGFTQDKSSAVKKPGTFLGIIEKIPYLKSLGINAIELMPIFEFNECENPNIDPNTGKKLKNCWGYSTVNYFSPMNRFSSSPQWTGAMDDFRNLVKEMHRAGIEVYLDVVYNHTAEGGADGPLLSFKGIDNSVYYLLDAEGKYLNFSGTGNTFNANHPVVIQLILDSLRYWVSEMHVDGFRFDLASCLTRDGKGIPLTLPPLIQAINDDPLLTGIKLIAEAWDAGGLYQVGSFPEGNKWFEWNGKYRDIARRFIKGDVGQSGDFARALTGSQNLYWDKGPNWSINFITAHDGYTLRDLVSYQDKHNWNNGENNQDGASENDSWNHGVEGETSDVEILLLRRRQMRNFHVALMISIGTPMILMGDEYGHTKNGNNNTYCQDNSLNAFLWDRLKTEQEFVRFHRLMIHFRIHHPILKRKHFLTDEDILWHNELPHESKWDAGNQLIVYTLLDKLKEEHLYVAFNAFSHSIHLQLPDPPLGKKWHLIVDTSLESPDDFCEKPKSKTPLPLTYAIKDRTSLIAKAL